MVNDLHRWSLSALGKILDESPPDEAVDDIARLDYDERQRLAEALEILSTIVENMGDA